MTYYNERKCMPLVMKNKTAKREANRRQEGERIPVSQQ